MDYENYAERIKPLFDFDTYQKPKPDCKDVVQISIKNGEMTTHKIIKTKFSQLNDKRFYFPNGILSLPYGHPLLNDVDKYKKNKGQRIEKYFWQEKDIFRGSIHSSRILKTLFLFASRQKTLISRCG